MRLPHPLAILGRETFFDSIFNAFHLNGALAASYKKRGDKEKEFYLTTSFYLDFFLGKQFSLHFYNCCVQILSVSWRILLTSNAEKVANSESRIIFVPFSFAEFETFFPFFLSCLYWRVLAQPFVDPSFYLYFAHNKIAFWKTCVD